MAPHSTLFPGKSHGRRSLIGYSPWGHKELDTTERLNFPLQVADGLVKVQVALGNIASKRERVKVLYKKSKCFHEVPACPPSQAYASWFPAQALKPNRSLEFPFGDSR